MKLSVKGLAIASAILWASALLLTGTANLIWPGYGHAFLEAMSSIYPGYKVDSGISGVITGTLYALVDAGIAGALLAWLYNLFSD